MDPEINSADKTLEGSSKTQNAHRTFFMAAASALAAQAGFVQERDFGPHTLPDRYPEPDVVALDKRSAKYVLMPRADVYTLMWWADGFPTCVPNALWRRVTQTGRYALAVGTEWFRSHSRWAATRSASCGAIAAMMVLAPGASGLGHWTGSSDVIWTSPSKDSSGSMPLGNGEVGINLWVEEGGDVLFIISRTDSFSETARLLKVGRLRVSLSPNPFRGEVPFRQHLKLRDGICEITAGTGKSRVSLQVFVDAGQPVVHCVGTAASPIQVKVQVESWRTEPHTLAEGEEQVSAWSLMNAPFPITESADVFPVVPGHAVAWYHRNETSPAFASTMKVQSLEAAIDKVHDPLLQRTFGGWLTGSGFKALDNHSLVTTAPVKSFALRVAAPCLQSKSASAWIAAARKAADSTDATTAQLRTAAWWRAFWDRSWVVVNGDQGIEIPGGTHPLRIGYDSKQQNTFPGTIGRTGVYSRALSGAEVAQLAGAQSDEAAPVQSGLLLSGERAPREIANAKLNFARGFTVEAWIKTDGTREGRIFDKVTAGGRDGFLFDTYPKNSLRLIVGAQILQAPAQLLAANSWQHVAASVEATSGEMRVYLNGKIIVERGGAGSASPLTQSYTLQRYTQACAGRGHFPIKYNGSIFTVEPAALGKPFNADWRKWGEPHWFQNIRFIYHPMLADGDFEMMEPFFRLYTDARPLAEARTRIYYDAEGSFFPETMTVWGTYCNSDYGWDRAGKAPKDVVSSYIRHIWNQGPELVALMLDRWDYIGDEAVLRRETLPMAVSVLEYFDTRFPKDEQGRIRINPSQAVETFWSGVVNDMPNTAGLNAITARLCALPQNVTTASQRAFFAHMKAAAPIVPIEEVEVAGQKQLTLAPAQQYDAKRSNVENPELYAVWPFRLYGLGHADLETARTAYNRRTNHNDIGWGYDGNCAAILGLSEEAARILKVKCANSHPAFRWPASWGPNFDWLPDQDHGSNLLLTTQLMLLQSQGERIWLLPAWPKHWDVSFKLHAAHQTVVECVYRSGKIERLVVLPKTRRKDVVLPAGIRE